MLETWGVMVIFMLGNYLVGYAVNTAIESKKEGASMVENRTIDVETTAHNTTSTQN